MAFFLRYPLMDVATPAKLHTLSIARHTLKGRKGDDDFDYDVYDYKLDTLCEYYGIFFSGAHRASADAQATGKLFFELADARTSL